jgi:ribosomal protein L29
MSEFKDKTEKDLMKLLAEKAEAMKNFRFGIAGSKVRNVREGRGLRKDIARIETELSRQAKAVK